MGRWRTATPRPASSVSNRLGYCSSSRYEVRLIGEALGREVPFVELTHEEVVEELSSVMGEYAGWYLEGKAEVVDHPQEPIPTVEEVTGRPAMTFAEWAIEHADDFR